MSDLYGNNARSSSLESEDMNSFLHNLFHNSFTPPASYSCPPFKEKHDQSFSSQPPTAADSSAIGTVDSSVGFNFADPGRGFMADARDRPRYTFSKVCSDGITSTLTGKFPAEYDIDDFESDGKEAGASDTPSDPAPRRSAKRTRAAEVHNLSEKRRRSRINEKMKALQKLIPNSNKTDKASMLDEAIEYLKQLQLQVQMLSMRNGMSLYPFCSPGSRHATQLPQPEIAAEEHELLTTSAGDSFARNKEISVQGAFETLNQCPPSNQPNLLSPETDITDSKTPFGLEASARHHLGLLNHLTSPKDICQVSQLQLDMSCSGKNSSSGVSS